VEVGVQGKGVMKVVVYDQVSEGGGAKTKGARPYQSTGSQIPPRWHSAAGGHGRSRNTQLANSQSPSAPPTRHA